jgi:hypothetical protein
VNSKVTIYIPYTSGIGQQQFGSPPPLEVSLSDGAKIEVFSRQFYVCPISDTTCLLYTSGSDTRLRSHSQGSHLVIFARYLSLEKRKHLRRNPGVPGKQTAGLRTGDAME